MNKPNVLVNDNIRPAEVQQFCRLDTDGEQIRRMAAERIGLIALGYHRVPKPACAIADLFESDAVQRNYVAEALQYPPRQ